jgi:uncharacterized protein
MITYPIQTQSHLAIVCEAAEISYLPDSYEPLLLEAELLVVNELIEEELLLAIPDFPRHQNECRSYFGDQLRCSNLVESNRPFSVLAELKKTIGD